MREDGFFIETHGKRSVLQVVMRQCFFVVFVEEAVFYSRLFICENGVDVDVFHAAENAHLDVGICLFQLAYQFFCNHTLLAIQSVAACGAGVGEAACALNEVQVIVIAPRLYVILTDKVHRADKLHAGVIR